MSAVNAPAAVLCLHSSASSGRQWAALSERLGPGYRVMAPDLSGYGANEAWPAGAHQSLAAEARHLAPLVRNAEAPVHIVGHSYGAAVATRLALDYPGRVRSLVLYEPTLFSAALGRDDRPSGIEEVAAVAARVAGGLARGDHLDAAAGFVRYWAGSTYWEFLEDDQRARIARRAYKVPSDFRALFEAGIGPADLATLKMPVLCLCGGETRLSARQVARSYATFVPGIEAIELPGLGHMGPLTQPRLVNDIVAAFLSRQRTPRRLARSRRTSPFGETNPSLAKIA